MKLLFLDIDGVLNRRGTKEKFLFYTGLDRELLDRFLTWKAARNVEIVLSSSWRRREDAKDYLREQGLSWIGETPSFGGLKSRAHEILDYLDGVEFEEFAILDDFDTFAGDLKDFHLVLTDVEFGLQDEQLDQLDRILKEGKYA